MPALPARKVPLSRWLLVFLGLIAISAQSLLVQTHVHVARSSQAALVTPAGDDVGSKFALAGESEKPLPGGQSLPDDFVNCPLCQQWHSAGEYLSPSAAVLALPLALRLSLAVHGDASLALRLLSHAWHSRAPPTA